VLAALAVCLGAVALAAALASRRQPSAAQPAPSPSAPSASAITSATAIASRADDAPSASATPSAATVASASPRPRPTFSGPYRYLSSTNFSDCAQAGGWDYRAYSADLHLVSFTKCVADAMYDPPLHDVPEYNVVVVGSTYASIDGVGGTPGMNACVAAAVRKVPLNRSSSGSCKFNFGLGVACKHPRRDDATVCP
jgi:hypothetical protein